MTRTIAFERIKKFFGDEDPIAIALVNRLNNEFSHLESIPDRFRPVEIPEISGGGKLRIGQNLCSRSASIQLPVKKHWRTTKDTLGNRAQRVFNGERGTIRVWNALLQRRRRVPAAIYPL
jgi:hypothetical protein